jgi:hypothetical protein
MLKRVVYMATTVLWKVNRRAGPQTYQCSGVSEVMNDVGTCTEGKQTEWELDHVAVKRVVCPPRLAAAATATTTQLFLFCRVYSSYHELPQSFALSSVSLTSWFENFLVYVSWLQFLKLPAQERAMFLTREQLHNVLISGNPDRQ